MSKHLVSRWTGSFRELTLSRQLTFLVLATAMPLLLAMSLMFYQLANNERERTRQSLMVSAKILAALVDNEIDSHIAVAATLAQSAFLQKGDLEGFQNQAQKALEIIPGSWLTLSDRSGQLLLTTLTPFGTTLPKHVAPAISQRAFSSRRPQVSDLVHGPVSQRFTAFVEVPVFEDNAPKYSISISLPPARFSKLIENRHTQGELVGVVDRSHRFVARIPDHEARVGTQAAKG